MKSQIQNNNNNDNNDNNGRIVELRTNTQIFPKRASHEVTKTILCKKNMGRFF